jgi:predicted transcriptional regulator
MKKSFIVRLDNDLAKSFQNAATKSGVPQQQILKDALALYLNSSDVATARERQKMVSKFANNNGH